MLLIDTVLPGISGIDLVTKLTQLRRDVGIVVMSTAPLDGQHNWSGLGVYAYLLKPFSLDVVERVIDGAAHRQ